MAKGHWTRLWAQGRMGGGKPNRNPLRKIVGHVKNEYGVVFEVLECKHRQLPRRDFVGETNAIRRRCDTCGKEQFDQSRATGIDAMTTRFMGNCQICERDQKLHEGVLVHHGYNRPGHGYIVGDCQEEQAKQNADKAARKAEKDVARAARDAKKAATAAKQKALAEKRQAIREDFENKFRALANGLESLKDRQEAARLLLADLDKVKYRNWLSKWDLECEDAFVKLGLATEDGVTGSGRPHLRWHV